MLCLFHENATYYCIYKIGKDWGKLTLLFFNVIHYLGKNIYGGFYLGTFASINYQKQSSLNFPRDVIQETKLPQRLEEKWVVNCETLFDCQLRYKLRQDSSGKTGRGRKQMDLAGAAPKVWRREKLDPFHQSRRTITAVAPQWTFLIVE